MPKKTNNWQKEKDDMKISRVWAMPNKWTFTIKPIKELIHRQMSERLSIPFGCGWIDPYAGENSPAEIKNDLNPERDTQFHLDALDFLKTFKDNSVHGVLFDPPYSPRQVSECYKGFGMKVGMKTTQMSFWSKQKDEIARIVRPGGKVLCFGWNSMGCGLKRGFEMTEILLVPHGASKNDTIVTVEIKSKSPNAD